eukprot:TRINITY_DN2414_c3_g1_i1.p1 TRINITY_DN2414_c3_g1~~TRINITY_DN2414_c3_g1_i1.p1  ORF type:complete len:2011 (-),score=734.13 TRINITY_DN2414_c3_g1_i1:159-5468(-)
MRSVPQESAKQVSQALAQVRSSQQSINSELAKIRALKSKAEHNTKQKELELQEMTNFQGVLQEAEEKVHLAEDAAEKALITSEMIEAAGEDLAEVKVAVQETEKSVIEAQKSIGEARIFVNSKLATVRRYQSEAAKKHAGTELTKLQNQLQEAQNKLNPIKNAKQDFVQRAAAQKLSEEVLEKLTPAELEVDRAEEAAALLNMGEEPTQEQVKEADRAIEKASVALQGAARFLEGKKRTATGPLQAECVKLEERLKTSQGRLNEMKNQRKESAERANFLVVMNDAAEKVKTVTEAVGKALESEAPFLTGLEGMPIAETLTAVKGCETAAAAANSSVSIARMFLATKLVESKRLAKGLSEEAQKRLKEQQGLLEQQIKKLNDLKANTAERKSKALILEAERVVKAAEEAAKKVGEVASVFGDDSQLFALPSAEIKAAAENTTKAEIDANKALGEARKFITARQIETKHKEASGELSADLIKYQTRLSAAQTEVGKYKRLVGSVESRLAVKKIVEEADSRLKQAEAKVESVAELVEKLDEAPAPAEASAEQAEGKEKEKEDGPAKATKAIESAAAAASVGLKSALKYNEMQSRKDGTAKDELEKLKPRIEAAQKRLEELQASVRERAEKMTVSIMLSESEQRVKAAEDGVAAMKEAEGPFAKGDDLPVEEAGKLLADLEAQMSKATSAVGSAKTFLAMKRLASKRLGESVKESTVSALAALQERLDAAGKSLTDAKKGMAERRAGTIKRQITASMDDVEKKVAAGEEATKALADSEAESSPEAMKSEFEKAGQAQAAAQSALETAKNLLLTRQRDAKSMPSETNTAILAEISKLIDQVAKQQGALDKQKALLNEKEHKFVSKRLLKDAMDLVEKLEKKLEATTETAAPLAGDKLEAFAGVVFLSNIFDMFARHAKKTSVTHKDIFSQAADGKDSVDADRFVAFTTKLLELEENKDLFFSPEQQKSAFGHMCEEGKTEATEAVFLEQFRRRYLVAEKVSMTDSHAVKGGKATRKLDAGEIVEALDEPSKEESAGVLRVKARAEKDGKEGYITIAGNQGTVYLAPYSALQASQKSIDKAIGETVEAAKDAGRHIDTKADELKAIRTGPLAETKSELLKLRPKISKVQYALAELKKKVQSADKKINELLEAEKKKRKEAADKRAAAAVLEEVNAAVNSLQAKMEKALPEAEAITKSPSGAGDDEPLAAISKVEAALEEAIELVTSTTTLIKEKLDGLKGATAAKSPLGDLRSALVKSKVSVASMEAKCKKQLQALKSARKQASTEAHTALMAAIRADALEKNTSAEEVFSKMSGGADSISVEALRDCAAKLPGGPKGGRLALAVERYEGAGLSKLGLLEALQEFLKCVKEIAITTTFEVKDSKTMRKLVVGELVEVLEKGKKDDAVGLTRVKCRALSDGLVGWSSVKGNQGTAFLEPTSKPYFCCAVEAPLGSAFGSTSAEVRQMRPGETFELLEGPRKEPATEVQRVRGKAQKDGKGGWLTLKDASGAEILEPTKLLTCKAGIAITTTFDISEGKAIRKLDPGEMLQPLGEEKSDEKRNLTRMNVKAMSDNQEGWVTIKGNQGTAYAEVNPKLRVLTCAAPLEARLATGSTLVRNLEAGEAFEVGDAPKTDVKEGKQRAKGRNLSDGSEGWFTVSAKTMLPWTPMYKCTSSTVLHDGRDISTAQLLRKIEPEEKMEALAAPAWEEGAQIMRVRVRCSKDGKVGYATIRGDQGTVYLEPVAAAAATSAAASGSTGGERAERRSSAAGSSSAGKK